jgi:hypothetical protein
MRNGDAMTKPVDLDALDAAHAAATPGEWVDYCWSDVVAITNGAVKVDTREAQIHVCEVRRGPDGDADCRAIATLHNAYPAMAAELRALREVAEAARAFVPPLDHDPRVDALRAALAKVSR